MNSNQQMELQYVNTGYPYTVTESFVDGLERLPHAPEHYVYPGPVYDQGTVYWSMNMNSYMFEPSDPGSASYYGSFVDHLPRTEVNRWDCEYSSPLHIEEPVSLDVQCEQNAVAAPQDSLEECIVNHEVAADFEVVWQNNIDPDNMTYEELLDLGEAVGTHSRGLSQELIKLLPISRYKVGGFFSRKKIKKRCVICMLSYKMGDPQITLPCKHVYHKKCGTKWLSISKACPICNCEVFGGDPKH